MGGGVSAAWDAELGQKAKSAARGALRWGRWPAAASRDGRRGEGGFCVAVPRLERRRRPRWERRRPGEGGGKRRGRLGPSPGGGRCCSLLRRSAPGVRPAGFQFMAQPPRVAAGGEGRRRRRSAAANLPARSLARPARGTGAPGTTSRPAEMTRGLLPPKISLRSPRVRGARSTSPPPARRRAVPPPGPTVGAHETCARACAGARPGRSCARQAARYGRAGDSSSCLPALGGSTLPDPRPPGVCSGAWGGGDLGSS